MTHKIFASAETAQIFEFPASAQTYPGHIVLVNAGEVAPSDSDETDAASVIMVALEQGSHRGATIDTAYEIGDLVNVGIPHSGQKFYAKIATGTSLFFGAPLVVNGAGLLEAPTVDTADTVSVNVFSVEKESTTVSVDGELHLVQLK